MAIPQTEENSAKPGIIYALRRNGLFSRTLEVKGSNLSDQVLRIFVVDDESSVCEALAIGLASQEVVVDVAADGKKGRLRPKFMTAATMFLGLIPIIWSMGTGADVMKRIAAPMIGGIFTSFLLELLVYPPIYQIWKWNLEVKRQEGE